MVMLAGWRWMFQVDGQPVAIMVFENKGCVIGQALRAFLPSKHASMAVRRRCWKGL